MDDFDAIKSVMDDNKKEEKTKDLKLKFDFNVFNSTGILSRGYFYYYILLWGLIIDLLEIIPTCLFGTSMITSYFYIIFFVFYLYIYYNLTAKRMRDILTVSQFSKFLPILYMIPIISLRPLFEEGKITPKLKDEKGYILKGENKEFYILWGDIKPLNFWINTILLIIIFVAGIFLYIYAYKHSAPDEYSSLNREVVQNLILWFIWFFANIRKLQTNINKKINYKKGFTRIGLALGYIIFSLIGLIIGSGSSFIMGVIGAILGFFLFKGMLIGINWIIKGFKND